MRPQWLLEAVVLSLAAAWLCSSKPTDRRSILLPPSIGPEHYDISLAPQVDKGVFHGVVVINGVAVADTDKIVFHCKSLVFNTTSLTDLTNDEELEIEDIQEDLLLQQCHLFLNQSLQMDHEYRLSVEFMGFIGKEVGLYKDFYMEDGVRHDILLTHFQPNYARTMFPCWDEPHHKAQFLLRVRAPPQYPIVISNMPATFVSPPNPDEDHARWVEFEETPSMSTYLLVVVWCDYLALTDSTTNTSVWAPRSRLHEAQLALNISVAVLQYSGRYFGAQYALPKLDHVAVPSLSSVAMENWGAILYQNDILLWEEGVSTWEEREMICHVICHEIIHQWLGNLVTTAWWNTTWLNEGVTSFYHYYIMDKVEPSWNDMDTMFVTQIQMVLNDEAIRNPNPLTNNEPVSQEAIPTLAFSVNTYIKGAAIIRMVFNLMAPDVFREAMVQYIIDNEYGSVDEEDLWQNLELVADLPVDLDSVMYSWTHQPGFPLVTVLRSPDGCITVKQEKYLGKDESDARWTIPLTYTTSSELDFNFSSTVWFPEDLTELDLEECVEPTDWIILNIRQTGFYRVNYDPLTWRALTHDLQNCDLSDIHPVNRAQLLNDGFDLAYHGLLEYSVILELSRYLSRETEYLPWSVAIRWFNSLRGSLYNTGTYGPFQTYALTLVENMFARMSLAGDAGGLLEELHRKQVVDFACGLAHPRCVKEATDTVYLLMSGVNVRIPLDLKTVLLCTAVRHGQDEVWHFVMKEYRSSSENEKWKYLAALACSSKEETVRRLLNDVTMGQFPQGRFSTMRTSSILKTNEERLNLLVELGKQDDSLGRVLDTVLARFTVFTSTFGSEVILQLLRSYLKPTLGIEDRKKISAIVALVGDTQNAEERDLKETIMTEIDSPYFQFEHEESVRLWLSDRGIEEEANTTPSPTSMSKDLSTAASGSDSEIIESTLGSTAYENISEEQSEEEIEGDAKDDVEERTGTGILGPPPPSDPGGSPSKTSTEVLTAVFLLLICVLR